MHTPLVVNKQLIFIYYLDYPFHVGDLHINLKIIYNTKSFITSDAGGNVLTNHLISN